MADHGTGREPLGTVAEETARLVDALGDWAQGLGAATAGRAAAGADANAGAGAASGTGWTGGAGTSPGAGEAQGARPRGGCERCASAGRAGEALTCQLCPLCQGIALLRTVRPETVERLADLAGAVSGALRDLAAEQFGQQPAAPPPRPGARVQDIDIEDDDPDPPTSQQAPVAAGAPGTTRTTTTEESTAP